MAAHIGNNEWALFEAISETYALTDSPRYMDPEAFNRFVRSRIPPRGKRFANDHCDTCAYIARSKNANVVAYTANFVVPAGSAEAAHHDVTDVEEAQQQQPHHHNSPSQRTQQVPPGMAFVPSGRNADCVFNPLNPMHPYFVNLEPSYIAARRKKGIQGDCDDLKMLERKFAYGYNAKSFDVEKHVMEQLPEHLQPDGRLAASFEAAALCGGGDPAVVAAKREGILSQLRDWWRPLAPMMGAFVALPVWPAMLLLLKPLSPPSTDDGDAAQLRWCGDADTIPVIIAVIEKKLSVLERVYVKSIERWFGLPSVDYIEVFGVALEDGKPTYDKLKNNGQYQPPSDVSKEELAEAMKN